MVEDVAVQQADASQAPCPAPQNGMWECVLYSLEIPFVVLMKYLICCNTCECRQRMSSGQPRALRARLHCGSMS